MQVRTALARFKCALPAERPQTPAEGGAQLLVELAEEALQQSQDRFTAGASDNLEVILAQESDRQRRA